MAIRRLGLAALAAAVVVTGAGCAKPIPGTPVAAPGQAGKPLVPADLASAPAANTWPWTRPPAAR